MRSLKNPPAFQKVVRVALAAALAIAAGGGSFVFTAAADDSKPEAKPSTTKKLTGAELYAIHCNRCHAERYPTEFNSAQWQTLLTHMRVRANLPAKQARAILKYLKEESGN